MDTDQIKGKVQNVFGKAEEAVGKAIGNQNLVDAGAEDRLKGSATETWGNAKDTVRSVGDTASTSTAAHGEHASATGESIRDRIVSGTERLKDSVNAKLEGVKEHEADRRDDLDRGI